MFCALVAMAAFSRTLAEDSQPQHAHAAASRFLAPRASVVTNESGATSNEREAFNLMAKGFSGSCYDAYVVVEDLGYGCSGGVDVCSNATCKTAWQGVKTSCTQHLEERMKLVAENTLSKCDDSCTSNLMQISSNMQVACSMVHQGNESAICTNECKAPTCMLFNWFKSCCSNAATVPNGNPSGLSDMMCRDWQRQQAEYEKSMRKGGCQCES